MTNICPYCDVDFPDPASLQAHKKSPEGKAEKLVRYVKTVNITSKNEEVHFTAVPGGPPQPQSLHSEQADLQPPDNKVTVEPGYVGTVTVSLGGDRQFYGSMIIDPKLNRKFRMHS